MKTTFGKILFAIFIIALIFCVNIKKANATYVIPIAYPGTNQGAYYNPQTGQIVIDCKKSNDICAIIYLIIPDPPLLAGPVGYIIINGNRVEISDYSISTNPDESATITLTPYHQP